MFSSMSGPPPPPARPNVCPEYDALAAAGAKCKVQHYCTSGVVFDARSTGNDVCAGGLCATNSSRKALEKLTDQHEICDFWKSEVCPQVQECAECRDEIERTFACGPARVNMCPPLECNITTNTAEPQKKNAEGLCYCGGQCVLPNYGKMGSETCKSRMLDKKECADDVCSSLTLDTL